MLITEPLDKYIERYTAEKIDLKEALKSLRLNSEKGPWVAGGCLRRLLDNSPISKGDIDVWFANGNQISTRLEGRKKQRHENSYVVFRGSDPPYNFIHRPFYRDVEQIFDEFDFTIVKFATDGHMIWYPEEALQDLNDRQLYIQGRYGKQRLERNTPRMWKYFKEGYEPGEVIMKQVKKRLGNLVLDIDRMVVEYRRYHLTEESIVLSARDDFWMNINLGIAKIHS